MLPDILTHVQYHLDDITAHPAAGWREAIVTGHESDGSLSLGVFLLDHDCYPKRRHIEILTHVWPGDALGCWRSPLPLAR